MKTIRALLLFLAALVATTEARAFTLLEPGVVGWPEGVVTYDYDFSLCPEAESTLLKVVDRAIALWNSVPTAHLKLKRGIRLNDVNPAVLMANTSPGDAIIVCSIHFQADTGRDPNWTLAVGGAAVDGEGKIGFGYAILNADPDARLSTKDVSDDELTAVVAHELGHSLGLGHSKDTTAIMYMEAVSTPTLAQDDVNAVTSLYKNPPEASENTKAFGCASIAIVSSGGKGRGSGRSGGGGPFGPRDFAGLTELGLLFAMGLMLSRARSLRGRSLASF